MKREKVNQKPGELKGEVKLEQEKQIVNLNTKQKLID